MSELWTEHEQAKQFANERDLSFYIFKSYMYVFDGGKRAQHCYGGMVIDGVHWEGGGGGNSSRRATEEEIEMWTMLGGPYGS